MGCLIYFSDALDIIHIQSELPPPWMTVATCHMTLFGCRDGGHESDFHLNCRQLNTLISAWNLASVQLLRHCTFSHPSITMHPLTPKGIDFGRRCSHCIVEVGRNKLSTCSRCKYVGPWKSIVFWLKADASQRRVRYCSKACQRAAWESHKPNCKSVADVQAEVHPDNISSYAALDAALTKWSQLWTFALHRWACVGMDLTNQSPDRAATYWYESWHLLHILHILIWSW